MVGQIKTNIIYNEDCLLGLRKLPSESIDCCVTSPPYYAQRDYGCEGQIGLEETPQAYIDRLTDVFMEVFRVLKPTGTCWLNIGDCYATGTKAARQQSPNPGVGANNEAAQNSVPSLGNPDGCKTKDLIGIPWMLAFTLRAKGWYLRQDIIWNKPNAMPESVKDRCNKSHEYIFLLSKSKKYYFDYEQIQEDATTMENRPAGVIRNRKFGYDSKQNRHPEAYLMTGIGKQGAVCEKDMPTGKRNKRDVWSVNTKPDLNAHFAVFPEELIRPCILAGCPKGGVVLDPFMGSGTTARVARTYGRNYIGYEINSDYMAIAYKKTVVSQDIFAY